MKLDTGLMLHTRVHTRRHRRSDRRTREHEGAFRQAEDRCPQELKKERLAQSYSHAEMCRTGELLQPAAQRGGAHAERNSRAFETVSMTNQAHKMQAHEYAQAEERECCHELRHSAHKLEGSMSTNLALGGSCDLPLNFGEFVFNYSK